MVHADVAPFGKTPNLLTKRHIIWRNYYLAKGECRDKYEKQKIESVRSEQRIQLQGRPNHRA